MQEVGGYGILRTAWNGRRHDKVTVVVFKVCKKITPCVFYIIVVDLFEQPIAIRGHGDDRVHVVSNRAYPDFGVFLRLFLLVRVGFCVFADFIVLYFVCVAEFFKRGQKSVEVCGPTLWAWTNIRWFHFSSFSLGDK